MERKIRVLNLQATIDSESLPPIVVSVQNDKVSEDSYAGLLKNQKPRQTPGIFFINPRVKTRGN